MASPMRQSTHVARGKAVTGPRDTTSLSKQNSGHFSCVSQVLSFSYDAFSFMIRHNGDNAACSDGSRLEIQARNDEKLAAHLQSLHEGKSSKHETTHACL